jgi:cytochrome c
MRAAWGGLILLFAAAGAQGDEQAAADADLQKCKICHSLEKGGANRVGPNLYGMFGRKAGSVAGFAYSDAVKQSGTVWDDASVAQFLRDPKDALPGNRMSFPGIKDETVLRDLVQSLKQATQ